MLDAVRGTVIFHKFALAEFFPPCFQEDMEGSGCVSGEKAAVLCQRHDRARPWPLKRLAGAAFVSMLFS